jgi:hypothetical protein
VQRVAYSNGSHRRGNGVPNADEVDVRSQNRDDVRYRFVAGPLRKLCEHRGFRVDCEDCADERRKRHGDLPGTTPEIDGPVAPGKRQLLGDLPCDLMRQVSPNRR